jgi:hypothetical protein
MFFELIFIKIYKMDLYACWECTLIRSCAAQTFLKYLIVCTKTRVLFTMVKVRNFQTVKVEYIVAF